MPSDVHQISEITTNGIQMFTMH